MAAPAFMRVLVICFLFAAVAFASVGDRLPEFKECLAACIDTNCKEGGVSIPIFLRLLLWNCPSNCDYTCQHVVTEQRVTRDPPMLHPIVQYHGKWPFHRFLGMQEPFSVLFSAMNFAAHWWGQEQIHKRIPADYPLRKWYVAFGYFGFASWTFSMLFHIRDFNLTEKLDYFAAGASVLYGLYYTPIRVFRLDKPTRSKEAFVRLWTMICLVLFIAHVSYLSFWSWDYTYNMAANVAVGIVQHLMWIYFSVVNYTKTKKDWTAWPAMIVAWLVLVMSLELFDFPPWSGMVDAHSLWHLGTVGPTIWWYSFLVKDSLHQLQGERLKA